MTTTKTQAFNNKIKALKDYHTRLISGVGGVPSSNDIQTTLKFFCTTLKGILKDTSNISVESYGYRGKDIERIRLFPTFHYADLYYLVIGLCEYVGKLNNQSNICEAILKTFHVLIPFLEIDNLDILPLIVTSCINLFPVSQHGTIIELLCSSVIPFVYTWNDDSESYAVESIPSILQIVFQHVEKQEYHSWVVESFMSKKRYFWKDLMLLIAYGSTESRIPATCLLFYYWPELCPMQFQSNQVRFPSKYHHEAWKAINCERTDCPNKASKTEAKKVSFEPNIAATYGNKVPPLYLCLDCFDSLTRNKITNFQDVVLPIKTVKNVCEAKTCRSKNNSAFVTCYHADCISLNGNKPIRFCEACHFQKHLGPQCVKHTYQSPIPDVWDCSMEIQPTVVEAIISLCTETMPRWRLQLDKSDDSSSNPDTGTSGYVKFNMDAGSPSVLGVIKSFANFQDTDIPLTGKYTEDDQKVISVYSAFLIGEKCSTKTNTNIEILGRILSGLFHWFLNTVAKGAFDFAPDGIGDFIEKIKRDYILKWIHQVVENNLEVVLMVLLPYPVEFAKIGVCWELLCDRSTQVKNGLEMIHSLIPYDIITFETWDYIIPFWLETLRTEIPESEYVTLQGLMKKIFDQHAGPFPFLPAKLYNFATQRFTNTHVAVQDQVLSWLDILTNTNVVIPMKELLTMFSIGVKSMHDSNHTSSGETDAIATGGQETQLLSTSTTLEGTGSDVTVAKVIEEVVNTTGALQDPTAGEDAVYDIGDMSTSHISRPESPLDDNMDQYSVLSCLCMMMNITNLQLHKNDPHGHGNMSQETPTLTLGLMCEMLILGWSKDRCRHTCASSNTEGLTTEAGTGTKPTGESVGIASHRKISNTAAAAAFVPGNKNDTIPSELYDVTCGYCQNALLWHTHCYQILKHIVPLNPTTFPEGPMTLETLNAALKKNEETKSQIIENTEDYKEPDNTIPCDDNKKEETKEDVKENIKEECKEEYNISELSAELKLIYLLVNELDVFGSDPEIINSILTSVSYMIRHAELLKVDPVTQTVKANFIDYLLEKKLVSILWNLLCSEFSYLGELTVPLLLYCLTVKKGAEKFWKLLEDEFTNEDWRIRFDAVEKVTILARNIDNTMIVNNYSIISSLAHALSNLIGSLDDVNSAVVTRTTFYLATIRDKSLACIVKCLELQFDSVIADRTLILLRIYQLSWALPGRSVFSWDFFISRFGIFSIEAQVGSNLDMDISNVTDLSNQKGGTEVFRQQFERARIAISRTEAVRSISSSKTSKPLFRRLYSPGSTVTSQSGACAASTSEHTGQTSTSAGSSSAGLHSVVQPIVGSGPKTPSGSGVHHRFHFNENKSESTDKHRQSSIPPFSLGRRKSKPLLPGLGGLNVAEYTDSNNRFLTNIQEALDLDGSNRDTLHQWVTLLLKFMANVDMQITKDETKEKKALSKVQRHLALLLGYADQAFNIPPYKLRNSTVFHAFLANIAQVMDRNFSMGASILHQTLVVLQYCPSPQRYASDSQPATFSLWLLEPQTRIHWLNTLLIVLYKYEYNASGAGSGVTGGFRTIVDYLVRVAINTVENHLHVCKPSDDGYSPPTPLIPRPRVASGTLPDASNVSVEVDLIPPDTDTSPTPSTNTTGLAAVITNSGGPSVGLVDSLNLSRTPRATALHYAKKDKDVDNLTTRFTSPVIKKKVARQFHYRSTCGGGASGGTVSNSGGISSTSRQGGGSGGLLPIPASGTGVGGGDNTVLEERDENCAEDDDDEEDDDGDDEGGDSVRDDSLKATSSAKEIILTPITVSSDEKVIRPASKGLQPVLEESADSKEERRKSSSCVENKILEQIDQFASQKSTSKLTSDTLLVGNLTNEKKNELSVKERVNVEEKEKTDDDSDSGCMEDKPNYRQRKSRKSGLTSVEIQKVLDGKEDPGRRRPRRSELSTNEAGNNHGTSGGAPAPGTSYFNRHVESFMVERCKKCHAVLEHYDEETLGLAIVCFGAYVHREPALAAPSLYDMLVVAAKIASYNMYSWKINLPNIIVPGNLMSIARQFLRCTFYNLFPNGIFVQLFQTEIENRDSFFKCIVSVLLDFEDHLDLFQPIHQVLEGFNKRKAILSDNTMIVIENLAAYFEALPTPSVDDTKFHHLLTSWWMNISTQLDNFFHKLPGLLPTDTNVGAVLRMMIVIIRANVTSNCKPLMDTFGTLLKHIVENCNFTLPPILELCSMTNRLYKEKGKSLLTKCLIEELHAAIKFKIYIPDKNLLMMIQFVLMDAGGTVEPNKICEGVTDLFNPATYHILNTGSAELMRAYLNDCIVFLSDVHTVHRVKQHQKSSGTQSLHEDTLGSHLKSALAQYVALELSTSSSSSRVSYSSSSVAPEIRDSAILQYMPWLKSIPPATQQGPREFILCVERVRTLNWLLLGSMIHTCVTGNSTGITCQPIPLGFNKSIADLVKVILSGFPDQQKTNKEAKKKQAIDPVQSVIVMSSLYHAFVLCQLWTMYCETAANLQPVGSQHHSDAVQTAMEFWMAILPTILQLLTISDDFVVVNGHLLTVMEELIECRSLTVAKVINWWTPILMGRNKQLPGNLQKRLQKCIECDPPEPATLSSSNDLFIKWLKKHVFVLGRNEDQHSAATHIFVQ